MYCVVFGIGKAGQEMLSYLEKEYQILFLTDNDSQKWEKPFQNYMIKPPSELKNSACAIIVTTARIRIRLEIKRQLKEMGIDPNRIFFCERTMEDYRNPYRIYSSRLKILPQDIRPLIQYDLYHNEEKEISCKKILVICSAYSVYTKQLIENLSKRYDDIEFSLLTYAKESKEKISSPNLKHIYYFQSCFDFKMILEQIPVYDAMQLLWIEDYSCFFYELIRSKTKKLNLNVGGSDFYREDSAGRNLKKDLIACADCITAETPETVAEFEEYYRMELTNPVGLLPFGVEVLDHIKSTKKDHTDIIKEKFGIPSNKVIVTCGHNAYKAHQHLKIIDALEEISNHIKKECVFVFPMTYPQGVDDYRICVRERLDETNLDYVILTDFMDFQSMAEYAVISDIMIHVQTTDQLSSTMLEEMYAGSIVIAGDWLPYKALHEMGIYFLDVNKIEDITNRIEDVVENMDVYRDRCIENPKIVWDHSSWDALAPRWHELWE